MTLLVGGRVLVVDDQPQNVKLMEARLKASGCEVLKAYNGQDAIRIAHESRPDIVLLDIMMPGMDGYEVCEKLKKDPETALIPIVLVTALEGTEDKVRGLDAGADDFLTKPVNQTELLTRVRSLVKLKRLQEEMKARTNLAYLPEETRAKGKQIILVVDDNEKIAKHCKLVLESEGYEVITAANGTEALKVLDETEPDLIMLDIILPDMDGIKLLGRIKANVLLADVPALIMSVLSDIETKVRGLETGADDYLVKPIDKQEMLARVRAALRKKELSDRLKSNLDTAFKQSVTDQLTGLYNRRYLVTVLEREIEASRRYSRPFSVLLMDIDKFKDINDSLGHLVGDAVLKDLGGILNGSLRRGDVASRYGGEEFVVVLTETGLRDAMQAAEKLRKIVEGHRFQKVEKNVTISIGVAEFGNGDVDMDAIIKRADDALYEAKQQGRNMVREAR